MSKQSQVQKRHDMILQIVERNGEVALEQLCEMTGCSETTVRNDLRTLEGEGKLLRTFGGAVRIETRTESWLDVGLREKSNEEEKRRIAVYIVEHILKPGMVIVLDAGTTCAILAKEIAKKRIPVSIITNSFYAAAALTPVLDTVKLCVIGGMYNTVSGSLYDEDQAEKCQSLRADIFFMGADAVSPESGVTITGLSCVPECKVKNAMKSISAKTYILADHSKLLKSAMIHVCPLDSTDIIITDQAAHPDQIARLQEFGIEVLTV